MKTILMLRVSTAHLDIETVAWMNEESKKVIGAIRTVDMPAVHLGPHSYGWIVFADEGPNDETWPKPLCDVMRKVRSLGFEWIFFDAEAETLDGVTVYERTDC